MINLIMAQVAHLPGPLRLLPAYAFAGRARELAQLKALLPRTVGEGVVRRSSRASPAPGRAGSSASSPTSSPRKGRRCSTATAMPSSARPTRRSRPPSPSSSATGGVTPSVLDALGAARVDLARLVPELGTRPARSQRPVVLRRGHRAAAPPHRGDRGPRPASRPSRPSCSCSRTSTGPTRRRCSSSDTSSARAPRPAC